MPTIRLPSDSCRQTSLALKPIAGNILISHPRDRQGLAANVGPAAAFCMPPPSSPLEALSEDIYDFTWPCLLRSYFNDILPSAFEIMPSMFLSAKRFAGVVSTVSTAAILTSTTALGGAPPTCTNPQTSCQNTTAVADLCCFNAPGGQLLQTQFWDTNPPTGPSDSWTVHGLWLVRSDQISEDMTESLTECRPDHCDGTYDQYCDQNRQYTNISSIISAAGATDLLNYMNTYWKDYQGNDESFWEHEWGKHGTCISTLEPSCYTGYSPQEEVVDYFQKAVDLFKTLDSYSFLSASGILPSTTKTYTSAEIQAALTKPRGHAVAIQCQNGELDEIWYFYNVKGSVQTGQFIAADPGANTVSLPFL